MDRYFTWIVWGVLFVGALMVPGLPLCDAEELLHPLAPLSGTLPGLETKVYALPPHVLEERSLLTQHFSLETDTAEPIPEGALGQQDEGTEGKVGEEGGDDDHRDNAGEELEDMDPLEEESVEEDGASDEESQEQPRDHSPKVSQETLRLLAVFHGLDLGGETHPLTPRTALVASHMRRVLEKTA